ncbi:hypothetical protein VTN31DRAFT_1820 [Thermomyces dupontii]|uniref:uncharacterized protein n=1 Tax=Talaromyces thermophilus TaxID=28565 RepID=UPI003743ADF8
MKLSVFALSGLLALAAAQNADDNSSSTKTATLSPQASCAAKECEPSDVCCLARCFEVPCPSEAMANDTTECAANCKQGDGSPKDTEEYARCQQNCFSSLFFPATATATGSGNGATGTSGSSASGTGSNAQETGGSDSDDSDSGSEDSDSDSASSTEEGESSESPDAASTLGLKAGTAGIVGAIVAALAL